MFCKHCGKEISDDSIYCKYCGNKSEKEIKETSSNSSELVRENKPENIKSEIVTNDSNDSNEEINIIKKSKFNVILVCILCLIFLSILIIFIFNNNTSKTTINEETSTEETSATVTETTTEIFNDNLDEYKYFNVNIDDFISNYNDYVHEIGKQELIITSENTEEDIDDDEKNEMTFRLNNITKFKAIYNPNKDYRISSIEIISKDKASNDVSDIINGIIISINDNVSKDKALEYSKDIVNRISNGTPKDEIKKVFENYLYEVSYTSNNGLEMYIKKEEQNKDINSNKLFDISLDDFINNYNEENNSLQINKQNSEKNDNNDYSNKIKFDVNTGNIIISYNPQFNNKIQAIESTLYNENSTYDTEVFNRIISSLNKTKKEQVQNEFDLYNKIRDIADKKNGYINKFLDNYNYNVSFLDDLNLNMKITKEQKEVNSEYSFDIDIDDFIEDYNEYINSKDLDNLQIDTLDNNNNDDYENISTVNLPDNIMIEIHYNSFNKNIKFVKFNVKDAISSSKDSISNVLNGIIYSISDSISDEIIDKHINNIENKIFNNDRTFIDDTIGEYRYNGGYVFKNNDFEISIYKETKTKNNTKNEIEDNEKSDTNNTSKTSIDDFIKNYNDYILATDYTHLNLNDNNSKKSQNDNENTINFILSDKLSFKIYYSSDNNSFIRRIKYDYNSKNIDDDMKEALKAIIYSINNNMPKEETTKYIDDIFNLLLKTIDEETEINSQYNNYDYEITKDDEEIIVDISVQ